MRWPAPAIRLSLEGAKQMTSQSQTRLTSLIERLWLSACLTTGQAQLHSSQQRAKETRILQSLVVVFRRFPKPHVSNCMLAFQSWACYPARYQLSSSMTACGFTARACATFFFSWRRKSEVMQRAAESNLDKAANRKAGRQMHLEMHAEPPCRMSTGGPEHASVLDPGGQLHQPRQVRCRMIGKPGVLGRAPSWMP